MRAYLLSNGSSIDTVNSISHSDAADIYSLIQSGMVGPYKDYAIAYNQYASLNLIRETVLGLMLGKKHKPEKLIEFHELYPTVDDYLYLGQGRAIRANERQRKGSLAVKAAAIFVDDSAPAWLKEAV